MTTAMSRVPFAHDAIASLLSVNEAVIWMTICRDVYDLCSGRCLDSLLQRHRLVLTVQMLFAHAHDVDDAAESNSSRSNVLWDDRSWRTQQALFLAELGRVRPSLQVVSAVNDMAWGCERFIHTGENLTSRYATLYGQLVRVLARRGTIWLHPKRLLTLFYDVFWMCHWAFHHKCTAVNLKSKGATSIELVGALLQLLGDNEALQRMWAYTDEAPRLLFIVQSLLVDEALHDRCAPGFVWAWSSALGLGTPAPAYVALLQEWRRVLDPDSRWIGNLLLSWIGSTEGTAATAQRLTDLLHSLGIVRQATEVADRAVPLWVRQINEPDLALSWTCPRDKP